MKLTLVVIEPQKLREYLLSSRKRNDKSKWLALAGYKPGNWQVLEHDLRTQILPQDAVATEDTDYGQMYEIKGILKGPNGKVLSICSTWMQERESKLTKFITMFPDKK